MTGLSPVTEKGRVAPWAGGGTFDKERRNFDRNIGGDHRMIDSGDTDGYSNWINEPFEGSGETHRTRKSLRVKWVVTLEDDSVVEMLDVSYDDVVRILRNKKISFKKIEEKKDLASKAAADGLVSLVANVLPACFKAEVTNLAANKMEVGSCFCLDRDLFATCAHVIARGDEVDPWTSNIEIVDGDNRYPAQLVDIDRSYDLALIRCDAVKHIVLGRKEIDEIEVGSEVVCIGSPYGYDNNVTSGIVSSKDRVVDEPSGLPYFFVDLSVFPGSSGGPVVDVRDGLVVGVVAIIVQSRGNYGLNAAIPIDLFVERFKQHLKV